MALEDDRLILHDLRGVNLKVDFFLGTREELINKTKCIAYSVCWDSVDVRVDLITVNEQISDLEFFYNTQQLFIDDQIISGEVFDFRSGINEDNKIIASCKISLGRDY